MMKQKRVRKATMACLTEAFRRFECFRVRQDGKQWTLQDIQAAWTGLGMVKDGYGIACDEGFMKRAHTPNPPHDEWWVLTEKGARVILQWHTLGYSCEGYEAPETLLPVSLDGEVITSVGATPYKSRIGE